ncbi:MAG TPA: hypothetical protein VGT03_11460 [Candidatus Acidoferrales bacterium]|nr:hypothetical protein [Candidatus Acidoferrales bacterium]
MNRNSWALIAAAIAVLAAAVLGFWNLGSPARERQIRQDLRTVQALEKLATQINQSWNGSNNVLPSDLERFPTSVKQDPTTHAPLVYHPKSGSQYELCATFLSDDRHTAPESEAPFWLHPSGAHCFRLDASVNVPQAPYSYDY